MSIGVGGSSAAAELARVYPMRDGTVPIDDTERLRRIDKAQRLMSEPGVQALVLVRETGPEYHRSELWRLSQIGSVVGTVLPIEPPVPAI